MEKQMREITDFGLYVEADQKNLDDDPVKKRKPSKENIDECRKWIGKWIDERKSINKNRGSYKLKQLVEDYRIEDTHDDYISNGAFIQAAVDEGYKIQPFGPNSPNAYFNMSFVRIKKEIKRRKEEMYNKYKEGVQ